MADVLSLVGTAIDTVKKLKEIAEKVKDADSRNLIADLSLALADLKIEIARLKEENLGLQTKLKQLATQDGRADLETRDGVLFLKKEATNGRAVGPYCPNCFETTRKLILMQDLRDTPFHSFGNFRCSACKAHL